MRDVGVRDMQIREWLARSPVVAILRGIKPEEAEAIGWALEEAGISIIEVPLNSPDPFSSIERLARVFGDRLLIGAGTLTSAEQVRTVGDAGGRLVVTPHAELNVVHAAKAAGMFALPGFANPTEAFALLAAGADAIKLFPAEVYGVAMLKAMRAVLPVDAMVIPVGGVDAATIGPWLAAGAHGVGAASSIYKPGDTPQIVRAKAGALVNAVHAYHVQHP